MKVDETSIANNICSQHPIHPECTGDSWVKTIFTMESVVCRLSVVEDPLIFFFLEKSRRWTVAKMTHFCLSALYDEVSSSNSFEFISMKVFKTL